MSLSVSHMSVSVSAPFLKKVNIDEPLYCLSAGIAVFLSVSAESIEYS